MVNAMANIVFETDVSAADTAELDFASARHIGQDLRDAREARSLSLQDVADKLHISAAYLGAIERLDKDALPSLGYVLGFMRSYAKFLGLDVVDSVARYKVDSEIPQDLGMRDAPHFVASRKLRLPKGSVSAIMTLSALAMLATWYSMTSKADAASPTTVSAEIPNLGLAAPQPTTGNPELVAIQARAATWVQITDPKGNIVTSRIFVPGELFEAKASDDYLISARDAGALSLYRAGDLVGPIGGKGQTITGLSLQ